MNLALGVLMDHLPEARRLEVGRPDDTAWSIWRGWRSVWARRGTGILHLNPSVRPAALARDMALLAGWKGPAVAWLHGWSEPLWRQIEQGRGADLLRRFCGRAKPVVLCGYHRERLISVGVPAADISVIGPPYRPAVLGDAGRADGAVLFVGRMVADKGAETLMRARQEGSASFRGRPLVFLGSGPQLAHLRALAAPFSDVELPGWVDEECLRGHMDGASMVVLPTRDDAMPLCLIEALASRVPVVSSSVGGIPELVGAGGLLVTPQPRAIAAAIDSLWNAVPEEAMRDAASRVRGRHSPQSVAAAWREVYRSL